MTPACMTPTELDGWTAANRMVSSPAASPCSDCPMAFARAMRAEGCCNGEPGPRPGRRQLSPDVGLTGRHGKRIRYATEGERVAARRQTWRESSRRRRAHA